VLRRLKSEAAAADKKGMRNLSLLIAIVTLFGACSGGATTNHSSAPNYAGTYFGRLESGTESREATVDFDARAAQVVGYGTLDVAVDAGGAVRLTGGTVSYLLDVQRDNLPTSFGGSYEKRKPDSISVWTGSWNLARVSKAVITTDTGETFIGLITPADK